MKKRLIDHLGIILTALILTVLSSCSAVQYGEPEVNLDQIYVYAHVQTTSIIERWDNQDIWGAGVSNYGCYDSNEASINYRKLLWDGNSFSCNFTEDCDDLEEYTVRINGKISADYKTLESLIGKVERRISNDSIIDNEIIISELSLQNVPLEIDNDGAPYAEIDGSTISQYVSQLKLSYRYKHENREPETYHEKSNWDFSDPDFQLLFLLKDW